MYFDTFYSINPHRINRIQALKAYEKAVKNGASHETIINGATKYQQSALEIPLANPISPTLQHGLIKSGGIMTTEQMIRASQPRQQAITIDSDKLTWQFQQHLTSIRKRKLVWCKKTETMGYHSEYTVPDGITKKTGGCRSDRNG